jgi:hypothetical protein
MGRNDFIPAVVKKRAARDQQIRRKLRAQLQDAPWIQRSDRSVTRNFARLDVLIDLLYERVRASGPVDDEGNPRPVVDLLRRMVLAHAQLASALGLTVKSRLEIQAGSRSLPVDAAFEARVNAVHAIRHGGDDDAKE